MTGYGPAIACELQGCGGPALNTSLTRTVLRILRSWTKQSSVPFVSPGTPLEVTAGVRLRDEVAVVPVLRAGLGMVEGFLRLLPDPMPATGGSAVRALHHLKRAGGRRLELVCLVAAPTGIEAVSSEHPDVPNWTAAVDRELDENAYICPGLGDAGDRVFGTA